jgi:hypothetical protein
MIFVKKRDMLLRNIIKEDLIGIEDWTGNYIWLLILGVAKSPCEKALPACTAVENWLP